MRYVIIDIGCLECGASSELVEVTDRVERVTELGATLRTDMGEHDWHGEVIRVAFEL